MTTDYSIVKNNKNKFFSGVEMTKIKINPLIRPFNTKHGAVPFDNIKTKHFIPAIDHAMDEAKAEINKIKQEKKKPTFKNTILAFETSGELLNKITTIYFNLYSSESDDKFKSLAQEISPKLAAYRNEIMLDTDLFRKISKVYKELENLDLEKEQKRLTEEIYSDFIRNGANLSKSKKDKLKEIDQKLSKLSPKFSQNLLGSTNNFKLHIKDKKRIKGLPKTALENAAETAQKNGKKTGWMFTLQFPSVQPVMKYAQDRKLRKKINRAFQARAYGDKFDNREILMKIAGLRQDRAELLGYKTHAHYVLERRMAKNIDNVEEFLNRIFKIAMPKAEEELNVIRDYAYNIDGIEDFSEWDLSYYSEKYKKEKYDFDEEELRKYLKVENVVEGLFKVANKLYGLNFKLDKSIPVYHKDVKVFGVLDSKENFLGLLYMDLFPRETKNSGAWMTTYRTQGLADGEVKTPQVAVNANLTPSTQKTPSLLNLEETTTLFHEFGHALHALLSNCKYKSLASPNVYWDFVELPSQIMENWVYQKEALDLFAKHYKNNSKIPSKLVKKIKSVEKYNKGLANIRQLSYNFVDLAWHAKDTRKISDVSEYEEKFLKKTRLLPKTKETCRSCSFAHIFSGAYAAGYYSYKWAEVLEADAFYLFKEKGLFDKETALSFKNDILAKGNVEEPMTLFKKFRGRKPDPDALLKKDGLM